MRNKYDGILLFSGGLDSILAGKLLVGQGLKILGVHFSSPFFGSPEKITAWSHAYGLELCNEDIGAEFAQMLTKMPPHGIGSTLNPCIDCKIMMLANARRLMREVGAQFVATGEVTGQRPMSQRRDALDIIAAKSGLGERLLRPLCAKLQKITPAEEQGLVNRESLLAISGRDRKSQLSLAKEMGIDPIPGPGGGCLLTQRENARKYWPMLRPLWQQGKETPCDLVSDFNLTHLGRILFRRNTNSILCVGRNERDNAALKAFAQKDDIILRLPFPGPLGIARRGRTWTCAILEEACAVFANYSPLARKMAAPVEVIAGGQIISVIPGPDPAWHLPTWPEVAEELRLCRKEWLQTR